MLTLRQLRYFQALAETLHFGRAARALAVSQPALSEQIAQMEATLGAKLFERRAGGVSLSVEGRAVLGRVRAIVAEVGELEAMFAAGAAPLGNGRLRLGLIATVAPYLLPRLLPLVAEKHPALELSIRESLTDALLADVAAGALDCALVAAPLPDPGLAAVPVGADVFRLAVAVGDGRSELVELRALAQERLILLEEGHCLRTQTLSLCQAAEAGRIADLGATSLATILRMVAGGLGATLIPEIAVETETAAGGLAALPFREPAPARTLVLACRRSEARLRDAEALATLVRAALPTLREP